MDIDNVLTQMVEQNSSDLHLKVGRPPLFRKNGDLHTTKFGIVNQNDMMAIARLLMSPNQAKHFQSDLEADFSYTIANVGRFRVNAFIQMGNVGMVFRHVPLEIPTLEDLDLPPVFKDITQKRQGLILVTGPTGSGKSTTLAGMIEYLNQTRPVHIITIEDPVEFIYTDKMAVINQRYVGQDTANTKQALRRALRQDPDVILFGELRDSETAEIAVSAAETGHLVFTTLHTNDAKQTVDRLIDLLGQQEERQQILNLLSLVLEAIVCQRLIKRSDGYGRVAACEIMVMSPHIRQLLQKDSVNELEKAIAKSQNYYRMQTFNQALADLIANRKITEEEGLNCTTNPDDLRLELRGISSGGASANYDKNTAPKSSAAFNVPPAPSSSSSINITNPPSSTTFTPPPSNISILPPPTQVFIPPNPASNPASNPPTAPTSNPKRKPSDTSLRDRISKEGLHFYRDKS